MPVWHSELRIPQPGIYYIYSCTIIITTQFDSISTGYLSDPRQAEAVCGVLDRFDSLTMVAPLMEALLLILPLIQL